MDKIISWAKSHKNVLIGVILLGLCLRGCSSCSSKRDVKVVTYKMEKVIAERDSIMNVLALTKDTLKDIRTELRNEKDKLIMLEEQVVELKTERKALLETSKLNTKTLNKVINEKLN